MLNKGLRKYVNVFIVIYIYMIRIKKYVTDSRSNHTCKSESQVAKAKEEILKMMEFSFITKQILLLWTLILSTLDMKEIWGMFFIWIYHFEQWLHKWKTRSSMFSKEVNIFCVYNYHMDPCIVVNFIINL